MNGERNAKNRSTRRSYPWPAIIAYARRRPVAWVLHPDLANAPRRTVESINLRRHPALDLPDGRLRARAVNIHRTATGAERCDVWVRYEPKESTNHG